MSLYSEAYLPALRLDHQGRRSVDYRAIAILAFPLFLDSLTYIIVNLTDNWFIGRISTDATAAVGAIHWLMFVLIMLLACVGVAVQTQAAQAFGSGNLTQAAKITWMGIWAAGLTIPIYSFLATHGALFLVPFRLNPEVESLALLYWFPRMLGGAIVVADWSLRGFFNATNRTRLSFVISATVCIVNAILNELLMFQLGWGIAGAAWATTLSQTFGVGIQLWLFLHPQNRKVYQVDRVWQPNLKSIFNLLQVGAFIGLLMASDLVGLAIFQIMQVELGVAPGAATQLVIMLLSLGYQPVVGFGEAAIILIGQSIGAGDRQWAKRMGNAVIRLSAVYMVCLGLGLAIIGKTIIAPFVNAADSHATEVLVIAPRLLWIAAGYQLFYALNIASSFCLQGIGEVKFPAIASLSLGLLGFIPLAHSLSFESGQGFVNFLPQFGFGVWGGWIAYAAYVVMVGSLFLWRWKSSNFAV